DFERNTRATSGGKGAITTAPAGGACGAPVDAEVQTALAGGLDQPVKELSDRPENCTKDWDAVEAFMRQIRPVHGRRTLDAAAVGPTEVACVLRSLGTFGLPGDATGTDALEKKGDATGSRAQGAGGYNVPSLYGLAVGAPYLHHGQAATLQDLFDDSRWQNHL